MSHESMLSSRELHSSSGRTNTDKSCTHYFLRHSCIVPAHSLKCFTKWLCTGHRLVLTERIRDPALVMMTFSARSATMVFKSEGVMHTLVSAAQKHAFLPAWNRAQRAALTANSQMQRQRDVATTKMVPSRAV